MSKKSFDLALLNKETNKYFYKGYDIFFIHGWFSAYLSAPSDSEEDDVIPTYLVLNEEKVIEEQVFNKFVDQLMLVFGDIAENIFEKNKALKPLVSLDITNVNDNLSAEEKHNLFIWLYGYLSGFVVIGSDITEYCRDDKLLDEVFFPALMTVCSALLLLAKELNPTQIFEESSLDDFNDLCLDLQDMWEADEEGKTLVDTLQGEKFSLTYTDLTDALTAIFFVVRTADEARVNQESINPLLKNLSVH